MTMRLTFGPKVADSEDAAATLRPRLEVYIELRDAWVGAYVAREAVYVCPLPFLVLRIARGPRYVRDPWLDSTPWEGAR